MEYTDKAQATDSCLSRKRHQQWERRGRGFSQQEIARLLPSSTGPVGV